ncbi:uncharacterized protein PAC_13259 [Phialocephala subalpina]|uniref:Uncharacterized protein n=1 Tax=Phialocephala subalpina TaxID=576137 RepID=A0A1L7XEA9_9HELO|nr:uncharacterized protein PAC_13259 [Phialocephala subalpina]
MPARKGLGFHWLHAGLFRDCGGNVHDIYYAFMPYDKSKDGEKMYYAIDNTGNESGNFNIGRNKFDLITWDQHHLDLWEQYLTPAGTWVRGKGMRGRRFARRELRRRYHDRRFHDPYANGKTGNRSMGPPLNVNFREDNFSGPMRAAFNFARRGTLARAQCYPNTNIPLSADEIKIGAWKDENPYGPSAMRVVGDFLTGILPPGMVGGEVQLDRIESAFFESGWRVNRNALSRAYQDMINGAANAFHSQAWRQAPPLRVDIFKGEEVQELMQRLKDEAGENGEDGDNDNRDDDDSATSPRPWRYGENGGTDDSDSNSDDDDDLPRPAAKGEARARPQQRPQYIDSDSSDSSDSESAVPARPIDKRKKKKGEAVQRRRLKNKVPQCQPVSFHCITDSDDEDEKDEGLFVTETRQSSLVVAGPSNRSNQVVRDRDEELARRLSEEEEEEALAGAMAQEPTEILSDSDEDEYLSENSPKKGKGKAAKKRPITSFVNDSDSDGIVILGPTKRARTKAKLKVIVSLLDSDSESDVKIDEAKSCKSYVKDEVIELKDEDSDIELN